MNQVSLSPNYLTSGSIKNKFATQLALWTCILFSTTFTNNMQAQLTGTKNIPGNYATLTAAIADLNAQGVGAGGVTFNVIAGNPQAIPSGGYVIGDVGSAILSGPNATSSTKQVMIQGNGNTATASAALVAGNLNDGIFKLIGADWITIQGFTMMENAANLVNTPEASNNMTEWGVALLYVSLTDGAQNNTIKNNTITLNKLYQNTFGIYSNVRHSASNVITLADITDPTNGPNTNNKVYNNAINNVNIGIVFIGSATAANMDNGNDIGGASIATANIVTNYGGLGALSAYNGLPTTIVIGAYLLNQNNFNLSFNSFISASLNTAVALRGILTDYSSIPVGAITNNVNGNTVTFVQAGTGGLQGVTTASTAGAVGNVTMNLNSNNFINNAVTGAASAITMFGVANLGAYGTLNMNNNIIRNNTSTATTGGMSAILNQGAVITAININNNQLGNATGDVATFSAITTGLCNMITNSAGAAGCLLNINGNSFKGLSCVTNGQTLAIFNTSGFLGGNITITNNNIGTTAGGFVSFSGANSSVVRGIESDGGSATTVRTITGNDFRGFVHSVTGSSTYSFIFCGTTVGLSRTYDNNTFTNITLNTTGSVTFFTDATSLTAAGTESMSGNSIVTGFSKPGTGGTVTIRNTNASSAAGSTETWINNNFSNISLVGAAIFSGFINTDGGTPTKTISNNTINNLTISGGTSGAITGISSSFIGGTTSAYSNNILTNFTGQGAITGLTIGTSGSATTINVSANTIANLISNGTGGTVTGLSYSNPSTTGNVTNNTINTLSSTGVSSTVVGLAIAGGATVNVTGNNVNTLSGSGATSPLIRGISVSAGTTVALSKNKIYNLSESAAISTTAGAVNGILLSGGTTLNISNNLIGDLRTPAASLTDAIRGINITSATASSTLNIYYNTVYINAQSTGANFGTTGIFHTANATATTVALDLRNNIIVNNSTPNGTGFTVAFRRSLATLANYATTSNNNLFWAGGTGACTTRFIYHDGTTGFQMAPFQAAVTPRETVSVTEDPPFISTTGSLATFLHINPAIATQIESGAATIGSITDDFDGNARAGTPDIGADEYSGVADVPCAGAPTAGTAIASPAILCSGQSTTICLSGQTPPTGIAIQWQSSSTSGGPYSDIVCANGSCYTTGNLAPGTYYYRAVVTCTNSGLSSPSNQVTVTVNTSPVVTVNPLAPILCSNSSVTLTASGASTYLWSPATGLNTTTGAIVVASPTTTTTYTVTGTDGAGCTGIGNVTVNVIPAPSVTATATPSSICAGGSSQLNAVGVTGGIPYTLSNLTGQAYTTLTGGGITIINTNAQLTPTMGSATEDDGGIVITLPFTFSYMGSSFTQMSMCTNGWVGAGNQGTIDATSMRTPGNLFISTIPNNTIAAWFKDMGANFPTGTGSMRHGLIGTDIYAFQWDNAVGSGFSDGSTILISFQVNIYGPASVAPGRIDIIYGPTVGAIAFAASEGVEDGIGGPNHYINAIDGSSTSSTLSTIWPGNGNGYRFSPIIPTYSWSPATFLNNTTIPNPLASGVTATTTYNVTVTSGNGCTASTSVTVTAGPVVGLSETDNSGIANNDRIICAGGSATLTATGGTSYAWSPATGLNTTNGPVVIATPSGTTTYRVTVTDANACTATSTATITVNQLPTPMIVATPGNVVCTPQTITLNAGPGYSSYLWTGGATSQTIIVSALGTNTYNVTVTDANGCSGSSSATVTINQTPVLSETHVNPTDCFTNNGSIDLTVTPAGTYTYNWSTSTGSGLINGLQDQSGLKVGTYNVTVTNSGTTCVSTLSITLSVPGGCGGCDPVGSVTVSPGVICNGSTATFTAVGTLPGATFAWFNAPTGGMQVGTGNPFTSGPLSTTTTYCVEQTITVPNDVSFVYTGTAQTFTVPVGVTSITINAYGGQGGGGGTNNSSGALGGFSTGTLAVVAGQVLNIFVGGQGVTQTGGGSGAGGFNGGGNAGSGFFGGGGGGASDVRQGGNALANRVIIAGGGGGQGSGGGNGFIGGAGGGANGTIGTGDGFTVPGGGGTQIGGGAGGTGTPAGDGVSGTLGIGGAGGNDGTDSGGGGGGGYYGGGGGESGIPGSNSGAGGGGGSGYIGGVTGGSTSNNNHTGNGLVQFSFFSPCTSLRTCGTVVVDVTPPIITCPPSVTVQCAALVPPVNTASVSATDNSGIPPIITLLSNLTVNQSCTNKFTINRTYRATDQCNNSASCTQVITVFDNTPPALTCPPGIIVQCASQVPTPNVQLVTSTDNCGGATTVTFVSDVISNQVCINRFNITRTYRATDACGNSGTCSQIISVFDNTVPTLTCPAAITVQCASLVPTPNTALVTATDNCGGATTVTFVSDVISNQTCTNRFLLTRTYRATDACGNSAVCTQAITVFDNTPPTITCPAAVTVQCANLVPAVNTAGVVTADNCVGTPTVTFVSDVITNQTCVNRFTLTRMYRSTDACGNSSTCTQIITVFDNTPPTITFTDPLLQGVPNGGTFNVQCQGQDPNWSLPTFSTGSISATDNCNGSVSITYSEVLQSEGNCSVDGYIDLFRLKWVATDACGNVSTAMVFMKLVDLIPPVIHNVPADITVNCDQVPDPPSDIYATDECLCACILQYSQSNPPPGCQDGKVITRTWTAQDDCGNVGVKVQHITLIDNQGPVLQITQPELAGATDGSVYNYTCNEGGIPDFYDQLGVGSVYSPPSCGGPPTITFESFENRSVNCERDGYMEQQSYHWTGVDQCGNVTSLTIFAQLVDNEPPVLTNVPDVACVDDPALNNIDATDNCGNPHIRFWDIPIPNPCGSGKAYRRTYEAFDDCGNMTRDTVLLIPNDQGGPVLKFVNPILSALTPGEILIIDCASNNGQYSNFSAADVSVQDDCPFGTDVTFTENVLQTQDCSQNGVLAILDLEWSATDICGNESTLSVTAHVVDHTPPVLVNFQPVVTIGCNDEPPTIIASDNCGQAVVTINETIIPGPCAYEYDIHREITATDPCGNSTIQMQTVHVGNGNGPVIVGVVNQICDDLSTPNVTAYDSCAGAFINVTMTEKQLDSDCRDGLVIERTWTAVDACGHVSVKKQIIILNDNTPPEIQIPTYSIIRKFLDNGYNLVYLSQTGIILALNALDENSVTASDDCDTDITPTFSLDVTYSGNCQQDGYFERRVYTWVATDACGNSSSVTFSVDIMDDVPPVIVGVPKDATIVCQPLPPVPPVNAIDAAQPVTIVYTQTINPGNGQGEFDVIRKWVATDACGNTSEATQKITWIPNTFLECDIEMPASVPCNSHGVPISSAVSGGLGGVSYSWEIFGEECFIQSGQGTPGITIYVGWSEVEVLLTVTDAYGCSSVCSGFLDCTNPGANPIAVNPQVINPKTISNPGSATITDQRLDGYLTKLNLWPNPANGSLSLGFDSYVDQPVQFRLINFLGQTSLSDQIDAIRGYNAQKIDISLIPEGSYLMEVKTQTEMYTKVVVILRHE